MDDLNSNPDTSLSRNTPHDFVFEPQPDIQELQSAVFLDQPVALYLPIDQDATGHHLPAKGTEALVCIRP
jgi:hypothetical protein